MKLHPLKLDPLSVSRFYRKGHRLTQWMNAASLFGVNVFFYPFTPGFPLSIRSLLSCTHKPHKRGCPSSRHSSHVWHHRGQPRSRLYRQQWRPANDPVDCQWPSAYPYFTGLYFINGTYSDSTKGTLVTQLQMALAVWDWLVCARGVCVFRITPAIMVKTQMGTVEWNRIWKREWSIIKFLYVWTRYYGIACFALNLWLFNAEITVERCKTL